MIKATEPSIEVGFESDENIRYILLKADYVVREQLQATSLSLVLSEYACAAFAYQKEREETTALIDGSKIIII